ncbi:hypothetical protein M427DRAFT_389390 [Gonapodya prolifera JEL478]|uniref:Uncharacterized protein n=1 Tax=Gonapodya prolifera (strain JEL478) TaxID=1344416 RepID=A0A139A7P9_GONPJ|nr:hypothetical protein M427DRAFT_389390 [Gonapodya prolifera JEL478]|eukprot:KXS12831.1 hypothetical protein M427DRAFT_389390 [Gonapodya prolifera JEL478]
MTQVPPRSQSTKWQDSFANSTSAAGNPDSPVLPLPSAPSESSYLLSTSIPSGSLTSPPMPPKEINIPSSSRSSLSSPSPVSYRGKYSRVPSDVDLTQSPRDRSSPVTTDLMQDVYSSYSRGRGATNTGEVVTRGRFGESSETSRHTIPASEEVSRSLFDRAAAVASSGRGPTLVTQSPPTENVRPLPSSNRTYSNATRQNAPPPDRERSETNSSFSGTTGDRPLRQTVGWRAQEADVEADNTPVDYSNVLRNQGVTISQASLGTESISSALQTDYRNPMENTVAPRSSTVSSNSTMSAQPFARARSTFSGEGSTVSSVGQTSSSHPVSTSSSWRHLVGDPGTAGASASTPGVTCSYPQHLGRFAVLMVLTQAVSELGGTVSWEWACWGKGANGPVRLKSIIPNVQDTGSANSSLAFVPHVPQYSVSPSNPFFNAISQLDPLRYVKEYQGALDAAIKELEVSLYRLPRSFFRLRKRDTVSTCLAACRSRTS